MGKLVKKDKTADWKPRDMEIKINYCKCTLWTFHLAGLVSTYDNCFHFWNVGWGLIKVPVLSRFFDVATYVHRTFVLLNLYVTFIMQWTYVQKLQVCIVKQTFLWSFRILKFILDLCQLFSKISDHIIILRSNKSLLQ